MRLTLTLADGEEINYKMETDSVSIGRSSKCDLVIPHEGMSRHHCKIELKDGEIYITDLGSINGVFIDGKKLTANSSVLFQPFLHLSFGYVTSAQLYVDEQTRHGIVIPAGVAPKSKTPVAASSPVNSSSPSNLRPVKTQPLPSSGQKEMAKPEKSKKGMDPAQKSMLINICAFIGILGAVYYFLYAGKETTSTTIEAKPSSPTIKPKDTADHF